MEMLLRLENCCDVIVQYVNLNVCQYSDEFYTYTYMQLRTHKYCLTSIVYVNAVVFRTGCSKYTAINPSPKYRKTDLQDASVPSVQSRLLSHHFQNNQLQPRDRGGI